MDRIFLLFRSKSKFENILSTMILLAYKVFKFHIGETYGLNETNVGKNIRRIVNILKKCKQFKLPGKEKLSGTNYQYEVILVDATESPIERPKKSSIYITQGKRKGIQLKHRS